MTSPHPSPAGFSLIELLAVIAILAVLAGAMVAAFGPGQQGLQTSMTQVASTASLARDLAVTSNRRVRFVIVDGSAANPDGWRWQRYGILKQAGLDPDSSPWEVAAPFSQLTGGVYFGKNEQSSLGAGQMVDRTASGLIQGKAVTYSYVEFLPTGAAETVSGANIFSLARKADANGTALNAANIPHIGISQHTGRVRVEWPQ